MRIWRSRRHVVMLSGAALAVAGVLPSAASAATPAAVSSVGQLRGIYCTSVTSCWAVGDALVGKADVNQLLHWNGKTWSAKAVPSPGGTKASGISQLFAVQCTAPGSCWAVGSYTQDGLVQFNQVLQWNGQKWATVKVPQPGGLLPGDSSELTDVSCTSATSCWATGDYGHQAATSQVKLNQLLHWNGRKWARVTTPNPAGKGQNDANSLTGIQCAAARDCWAVGSYSVQEGQPVVRNEILHWTGKQWTRLTVPNPGGTLGLATNSLLSVSCTSVTSCFAAGSDGSSQIGGSTRNQLLRWNGKSWSVAHLANPDGTRAGATQTLTAVSCSSKGGCWAVGHSGLRAHSFTTLDEAFHWNGKKWSRATVPNPGGLKTDDESQLLGVHCATSVNCWAVGSQVNEAKSGDFRDLILHRTGSRWSVR